MQVFVESLFPSTETNSGVKESGEWWWQVGGVGGRCLCVQEIFCVQRCVCVCGCVCVCVFKGVCGVKVLSPCSKVCFVSSLLEAHFQYEDTLRTNDFSIVPRSIMQAELHLPFLSCGGHAFITILLHHSIKCRVHYESS